MLDQLLSICGGFLGSLKLAFWEGLAEPLLFFLLIPNTQFKLEFSNANA